MKKKVLLINLPSTERIYQNARIKGGVLSNPPLTFAVLAAPLIQAGHDVKMYDMDKVDKPFIKLKTILNSFDVDYVGISVTTPLYDMMCDLISLIKRYDPNITVVVGGPHVSACPVETLRESKADVIVVGEGDFTFPEIVLKRKYEEIKGIFFKKGKKILSTKSKPYINNLDVLPYPAWQIYNLKNYVGSKLACKLNPAGGIETSRGCVFGCIYCNKNIFGRTFRIKSAERVVNEMQYMLDFGFKEIFILEDAFTTNISRAKKICDIISYKKLNFPWQTSSGIRANNVDKELLFKMKRAGCYRVTFGIESGNQSVLNGINKNLKIEDISKAVKWSKEVGMEVLGSFMLGLPGDTKTTMQETINFAKKLELDYAKFNILLPLPGTPIFKEWDEAGNLKTKQWSKYMFHTSPKELYNHPNLDWCTIDKYYARAYRQFYLNPQFMLKRFFKSLKAGVLIDDIKAFANIKF